MTDNQAQSGEAEPRFATLTTPSGDKVAFDRYGPHSAPAVLFISGAGPTRADDPLYRAGIDRGDRLLQVDGVAVRVHPTMLPDTHPLASVRDSFNAVFVEGEAVGDLMFYGRGAGGDPTASAVLGDVIDAALNLSNGRASRLSRLTHAEVRPIDDLRSEYYINMDLADRPGALATVAGVFGDHGVSIRAMEQEGIGEEARLVFITHSALESAVQSTLATIRDLEVVDRVGSVLRVVGGDD